MSENNSATNLAIKNRQLPQHLLSFFLGGFVLSFAIDFLFWQKPFGYSFAIWVGLVLLVSLLLVRKERAKLQPESYFLIAALVATTLAAVWRMEPGTRTYNVLASLFLIGLLCDTLLMGGALRFRILDTFVRLVLLSFAAIERPIQALSALGSHRKDNGSSGVWKHRVAPVLRGILIAIPVLLVFSALFAAADPVFEQAFDDFFEWIQIDDWAEFLWRGFYILVLGVLFSGLLLHGLSRKRYFTPNPDKPIIPPFLGKIETFTVLGLIEALFAVFVFIQFRYFFGGDANITRAGYTFAEYARKGANELIVVAVLSLILYQVLHTITKTPEKRDRRILHILVTVLFVEVLIILFSSYQRVELYQLAYGFSRIRIRTYLFIGWLAALLLLVVLLEWTGKSKRFFAVLLFISLGFILSQAALNLDAYIVEQNHARQQDESLPEWSAELFDHSYLGRLSADAVPAMLKAADDQEQFKHDELTREMLMAELYCRQIYLSDLYAEGDPWFSHNPSEDIAWNLLKDRSDLPHANSQVAWRPLYQDYLNPEILIYDESQLDGDERDYALLVVLSNGEEHYCNDYWNRWE